MHKMYHYGYVCKKAGHGKHTAFENLPKSCPPELTKFISTAIQELEKAKLLLTWPTSYGKRVCAVAIQTGYSYAQAYEKHAGLPIIVYGKPHPPSKVPSLPQEQLRALRFKKTKHPSQ